MLDTYLEGYEHVIRDTFAWLGGNDQSFIRGIVAQHGFCEKDKHGVCERLRTFFLLAKNGRSWMQEFRSTNMCIHIYIYIICICIQTCKMGPPR